MPVMSAHRNQSHGIDWRTRPPRDLACPVCGAVGPKAFVLAADPIWTNSSALELFACPACESKFFPDLTAPAYASFANVDAYLKFYLEVGAGVDQLVRHLFAVQLKRDAHYLEIGCGFGFALDFARRTLGLDVLGIDPSPFAAEGARQLGVTILHEYLTPQTDLGHRRFDLAVASEVVEHVFEPLAFVRLIAERLRDDGVLVLTTPNGASAAQGTSLGNLIPLLSAGWHYILYSQEGLKRLLVEAGFRRIEIVARGHTLVAAATNGGAAVDLAAEIDRGVFRSYLEERRRTRGAESALAQGLGYRLLRELTNAALYRQALEVHEELRQAFQRQYGFDIDTPSEQWLSSHEDESFRSFALRYPTCLCGVAHLRGIIALNHEAEYDKAARSFALSERHGGMLRQALHAAGADDGETEMFAARSRILYLRARAYVSPQDASSGALRLLRELSTRAEVFEGENDEVLMLFAHLVALGALDAADALTAEVQAVHSTRASRHHAMPVKLEFEMQLAFGRLEINKHRRARRAALHFALAERAAKRWFAEQGGPAASQSAWRARHDRLLAWVVAGNAQRALLTGSAFTRLELRPDIPDEIKTSADRLVLQASMTFDAGPPE
jgi:SAM-dependent methyltransferase